MKASTSGLPRYSLNDTSVPSRVVPLNSGAWMVSAAAVDSVDVLCPASGDEEPHAAAPRATTNRRRSNAADRPSEGDLR